VGRRRRAEQLGGLRTGVRPVHLVTTSKMVCDFSGMLVQPHKAIVGANAFAHESGIHQDGMLKSKATYEIITPEEIGLVRVDDAGIVLGARARGRRARAPAAGPVAGPVKRCQAFAAWHGAGPYPTTHRVVFGPQAQLVFYVLFIVFHSLGSLHPLHSAGGCGHLLAQRVLPASSLAGSRSVRPCA